MSSKILKVYAQGNINNPVLIFLHAFPFSGDMWKDQINFFSEKYYCLAPDLPGYGESAPYDQAVTFESYVDSVLNYLTESKIETAIWCGLSMGGYLALRMYERAPELCKALILCDTKAGADSNEAKLKRWDNIQMLRRNRAEFLATQWQALVGESSRNNVALKIRYDGLVAKITDSGIASGLVALATRTDCTSALSKIRVPTLLLVGSEDKVTPVSESEFMAKAIVGSRKIIMEKTGHLSNLENPQEFNDRLSEFLNSLQ